MGTDLNDLTNGIGDAIKAVPELYKDGFKETVQESGKTLSLIPRAVNAALVPVRMWIAEQENKITLFEDSLVEKLKPIESGKIVPPEMHIAIPTIQALSYSMDCNELRDLYANLLAKSMNIDTKNTTHPSFVEIIKQLSSIDVRVFEAIAESVKFPLLNIRVSKHSDEYIESDFKNPFEETLEKYEYDCVTYINTLPYDDIKVSIDNLMRLKLIDEDISSYTEDFHSKIRDLPEYQNMKESLEKYMVDSTWEYEEDQEFLVLTSFGQRFRDVCVKNFND